jgi:hypothetical protein
VEYHLVAGAAVAIPQVVVEAEQADAYAAADAEGQAAILAPLQAEEAARLAAVEAGEIPLVVTEG